MGEVYSCAKKQNKKKPHKQRAGTARIWASPPQTSLKIEKYFSDRDIIISKRGFRPTDRVCVVRLSHSRRTGRGEGWWFRVRNGRHTWNTAETRDARFTVHRKGWRRRCGGGGGGGGEAIARRYGGRIDRRSHAPPRSHSSPSDRVLRPAARVLVRTPRERTVFRVDYGAARRRREGVTFFCASRVQYNIRSALATRLYRAIRLCGAEANNENGQWYYIISFSRLRRTVKKNKIICIILYSNNNKYTFGFHIVVTYVRLRTIGFSDAVFLFLFLPLIFPRRFRTAHVITTRDHSSCTCKQQQ